MTREHDLPTADRTANNDLLRGLGILLAKNNPSPLPLKQIQQDFGVYGFEVAKKINDICQGRAALRYNGNRIIITPGDSQSRQEIRG